VEGIAVSVSLGLAYVYLTCSCHCAYLNRTGLLVRMSSDTVTDMDLRNEEDAYTKDRSERWASSAAWVWRDQ